MIIRSIRRLISLVVLGFALLGFMAVPIWGRTGYQHVLEFMASKTTQAASEDAQIRIEELRIRLQQEFERQENLRLEQSEDLASH